MNISSLKKLFDSLFAPSQDKIEEVRTIMSIPGLRAYYEKAHPKIKDAIFQQYTYLLSTIECVNDLINSYEKSNDPFRQFAIDAAKKLLSKEEDFSTIHNLYEKTFRNRHSAKPIHECIKDRYIELLPAWLKKETSLEKVAAYCQEGPKEAKQLFIERYTELVTEWLATEPSPIKISEKITTHIPECDEIILEKFKKGLRETKLTRENLQNLKEISWTGYSDDNAAIHTIYTEMLQKHLLTEIDLQVLEQWFYEAQERHRPVILVRYTELLSTITTFGILEELFQRVPVRRQNYKINELYQAILNTSNQLIASWILTIKNVEEVIEHYKQYPRVFRKGSGIIKKYNELLTPWLAETTELSQLHHLYQQCLEHINDTEYTYKIVARYGMLLAMQLLYEEDLKTLENLYEECLNNMQEEMVAKAYSKQIDQLLKTSDDEPVTIDSIHETFKDSPHWALALLYDNLEERLDQLQHQDAS